MAFDLGGFLKKRWDTSVIRDAVSSNTAADQQRRQVAAQKAAPVQQPKVPYYGSFSPQVTNTEQAVQQTGRDLGRQQREGQITGQQFNDRFAQLLASTTKDSGYKTPMAQAGNFAKSIVKPYWETGDTVVKGAQLGVANLTNNQQAADNARLRRDQSYQDSIVKPVAQSYRMVADTPVGYLMPGNSARKNAEKQIENNLVELRNNTENFTQNKAKEIQDGIRAGIYDPQKAQAAIQELLAVNESANAQLGQFYDEKLASQGLNKDMTAAQAYATAFGNLASTAGLLISPASGTAIRQAGGNVVRRGIAELGTNSALNALGGASSAYGQGADLTESLKAGATQAGIGAVMMGAGYLKGLKGPAAVETNIPAAPNSLREQIQVAKNNVRLAINNPDEANVFKVNNPLDAKTTGLDINNPMGAQTKPLDVRNPMGAETGKKLSIMDRYRQATDIDAPNQDGALFPKNDAPQVGKTDPLESLKQEARKYKSAEEFVNKNWYKQMENNIADKATNSKYASVRKYADDWMKGGKSLNITEHQKLMDRDIFPDAVSIRKASEADAIDGIYSPSARIITLKDGTKIITDASLNSTKSKIILDEFAIESKSRGKGLGTDYVNKLKSIADDMGIDIEVGRITGTADNFWKKTLRDTNPEASTIRRYRSNPSSDLAKQQLTDLYNQATQPQPPKSPLKTDAKNNKVYHGSSVGGGETGDRYGKGLYVTTDKNRASGYANGGAVDEYSLDGSKLANLDDKIDNKIVDTLKKEINDSIKSGDDTYKDVMRLSVGEKTFSGSDIESARRFRDERATIATKLGLDAPVVRKNSNGEFTVTYVDDTLESLKNIDGNRLFRSLPSPTAQSLFSSAGYDGVSYRGMDGDIESVIYSGNLKKSATKSKSPLANDAPQGKTPEIPSYIPKDKVDAYLKSDDYLQDQQFKKMADETKSGDPFDNPDMYMPDNTDYIRSNPKSTPAPQVGKTPKKEFTPISQPVDGVPAVVKQVTSSDSANQLRSAADKNLVRLSKQEQLPQQISRTEVQAKSPQSLQNDSSANSTTKVKLNTDRLSPDGGYEAMARLDKATQETITKMSNQDIQRVAKDAGIDTKTYTDQQVRTKIAEQLNVRQDAVRLQNEADAAFKAGDFKTAEEKLSRSAAMGRVSREQGTDLARQLQARRIIANELDTPQQRMFKLLDNAGVNPEVYTKRLSKVDFSNPQEVVKAYRELVPAKAVDWLDTVRYNSMLSSPLTHIVNTASNALNVGVVAPLEKTLRGVADATGGLFGKERKYAAGEGAAYAKGSASNIKKAAGEFMDVMRGIDRTQNLDLQEYSTPLAIGGVKGATYQTLSFPMKMLGASDKFFRTLAEGGETAALNLRESKGIKLGGNKRALAEAEGAYRLYQQDTNLKGQGGVLQSIDSVTNSIMKLRKDHIWARFVFPFVKTPTNILKQGVEFSPLGFANAVTAADKTTALTRAAIGTAVFGASAAALGAGDLTWGTPTNKDARDRFLAEGKQPYAIRIGGKWVSFAKLPPAVSFPLALTAGIDDAIKQKKMSESTADAVLEGVAKWGQFLGDQSYVKNIGDTLAAFKGDADRATQAVANYPQQVVPFRALTSWFARMTDDTERKVDADASYIEKQVQSLLLNYPGLRQKVGTRDYRGQPIPANNPVLNSFAPFKITDQRATHPIDAELDANKAAPKATLLTPKQTSDIDKLAKAKINEYQNQLIQSDEYKALSSDDKRKRLASLAEDVKVVESRKYQTKYAVGERALDFTGKETVLSKNQAALILNGDISPYKQATSTSTPKTKEQSDYEVASSNRDLTMTRAKANNDLAAWNTAAAEEYDAIGKQIKALDPKTDQVKINTLIKKQEALQRTASSYTANGYIKKSTAKKGSSKKFTIPTTNTADSARSSTFTNLNRLLAGTTKTNSNKGKIGNKVALRKITVKGAKS